MATTQNMYICSKVNALTAVELRQQVGMWSCEPSFFDGMYTMLVYPSLFHVQTNFYCCFLS